MNKRWARDLKDSQQVQKNESHKFLASCYCDFGPHSQLWPNFLEIQRKNSIKVSPHADAVNSNE